jgi:predicted metal-binding membrane protein
MNSDAMTGPATGPADARGRPGGSAEAAPSLRQLTPLASLLLVAAAGAWAGVVLVARDMGSMPGTMGLGAGSFAAVWALMMAAMMLPSAAPFASLYSRTFTDGRSSRLGAFASGYLIVWTLAALPAYGLAWLAGRLAGGHPAAATAAAVAIFAACGAYQLTPVKDRCLARCRSPLGFMLKLGAYRGRTRDLRAGLYHGTFCLACCWALMALLVAFGLMNVIAMVVLAGAVLTEKTWARGARFSRALGIAALALAVAVIFEPGLAPGLHYTAGTGGMGGM